MENVAFCNMCNKVITCTSCKLIIFRAFLYLYVDVFDFAHAIFHKNYNYKL